CRISQAGALAALKDQDYLASVVAKVAAARDGIGRIAAKNGLTTLPSATNFVAVDCGSDANFSRAVVNGLIKHGVFVRMPFAPPQDRCIRVSAGKPDDLAKFAAALPAALADARAG
ncbi:MAG: pyridoxal phosphate-dependent aminotransferase, partial [Marinosulfonomonas sp.]|nr:pyridoxal phosphate-dependent aminotransferase [Marinosulfonomonas sp.]